MFRLAFVLALLIAPAAAAQAPPDERVAAAAMAEATVRFQEAVKALDDAEEPVCTREVRKLPKAKREGALLLITRQYNRRLAELLAGDLARLRTELADAQTRDPVLRSGRAAWRQLARAFEALPDAIDPCADVRAWRKAGAPLSETRKAYRELYTVIRAGSKEYDRKVEAAADRLAELGVPKERAESFSGD